MNLYECHEVYVRHIRDPKNGAYIATYISADREIDILWGSTNEVIGFRLSGMSCTTESKYALVEALTAWLKSQYDAGDMTFAGLSAFVERARIEYLQPVEAA
jgi:hypothetical protein